MKKLITALSLILVSQAAYSAQECSLDFSKTAANTRYSFSDDGVVTDLRNGLTWMRCAVGATWDSESSTCTGSGQTVTWQSALLTAEQIRDGNGNHTLHGFAGKSNWRLPNIKELVALTERSCHSPAMNAAFESSYTVEVGDYAGYIWSNTPNGDGANVMVFDSFNGEVYNWNPLEPTNQFTILLVTDE